MAEHNIFYYPYASFTNTQLPLLKAAAQYFDKLYILDPVGASWDTIGADPQAREAVELLRKEHILETIDPSEVLPLYEQPIEEAIRADLGDQAPEGFRALCSQQESQQGKYHWTLALAKVPKELQDQAL